MFYSLSLVYVLGVIHHQNCSHPVDHAVLFVVSNCYFIVVTVVVNIVVLAVPDTAYTPTDSTEIPGECI